VSKNIIEKSKLMQLISYLDDKDYKELGLWVRSPIHNSNQMVIDLYNVIKHKYRNTNKPINILRIIKNLNLLPYTASEDDISPRDKQELRRTMHLLSEQIEDFLIWKANQKDAVVRKRRFMDELIIRRAYPLVPAVMRKARKIHEVSPLRDIQHCKNEFLLTQMDLWMTAIHKNRSMAPKMKLNIDALRQYCLGQLLRSYCFAVHTQKIIKTEYSYPMLEVLKSYVSDNEDIEHYTIRVYYTFLRLVQEERIEDYDELKAMIYSSNTFDNHEFRHMSALLINFCSVRIYQGDKRFMQERLELYKECLKRGALTEGVQLSAQRFILIIHTALAVNQPEWTNEFIEQYGEELGPDVREDIVKYGKALCAFHAGKYDIAQDFLNVMEKVMDSWVLIEIKILLIKIYYDKSELTFDNIDTHPINSELEALIQLTRPGSKINMSDNTRLGFANFTNFFKRILNRRKKIIGKERLSIDNIKALKTELTKIEPLKKRDWLNDKLNELLEDLERV